MTTSYADEIKQPPLLWYDRPGQEAITEGLPLGNGHLGVLVLGGTACDRYVLNLDTFYTGGPYEPLNPDAKAALPKVQKLIFEGKYTEAAALAEEKLLGRPKEQTSFQPLGDLWVEFPEHTRVTNYRRQLNLDRAVHTLSYTVEGIHYQREIFVSAQDQVLVVRLTASRPGHINCVVRVSSEQRREHRWQRGVEGWYSSAGFGMSGRNNADCGVDGQLKFDFSGRLRCRGGRVMPGGARVSIRDANELEIICAAATNYKSFNDLTQLPSEVVKSRLDRAAQLSFGELLDRHLADHQPRFRRLTLELGSPSPDAQRPTDVRIASFASSPDASLAALYVQYARYLLLACSREKSQPANLQGIWNDKLHPPWGSRCTININTEMNYWLAQPAALPECDEPVLAAIEDLTLTGHRIAQAHYGARGWVAHHNIDLWRAAAPVDGAEWGQWPLGGAWLCLQLWDHYQFTLDREYLARIYPLLKGACEFFQDTLVEDPRSGHLVTCPSLSPENPHPHGTTLCAGPAIDGAILRDLLSATAQSAQLLGIDSEFAETLITLAARLPAYRIGKGGQVQEWQEDWDLEAPEPQHRHVSHLFGLHPSHQISPHATPALAAAARKTLLLRGDAAPGWSLAWKVNFWARLLEGDRALELLTQLLSPDRSYTNLFDAHPPFQIDGNFGGAAGILEMLVQSEVGRLHLLPALPKAWACGKVKGVCGRGGLTINLAWENSLLTCASIHSVVNQTIILVIANGSPAQVALSAGQSLAVAP